MTENNIFTSIEKIIGDHIPKSVVYILSESGFDTRIALKNLKADNSITQIENFFNKNYGRLGSGLRDSIYENIRPFSIAPGHRVLIESLPQYIDQIEPVKQSQLLLKGSPNSFSDVLKLLIETVENNSTRDPKCRRFDEKVQLFATYLYLISGRACYETISANLPLPQPNTILSYISRSKRKIIEGQIRSQELCEYLTRLNLGMKVWLCEDATSLSAKLEYDSSTDQVVGIALPIDEKTGMPQPYTYLARSVEDIHKHSKEPLSGLVYVVLAQPIMPHVPPFVLQIFGTDNKFTSMNVYNRWRYTERELKKCGIEVQGWSSDGDARLLKNMLRHTNLNVASSNFTEIGIQGSLCFQDNIHIGTKLRNRLLHNTLLLILGDAVISLSHLKMLINNVPKEKHGLTMKDICPDDRQNYASMEKMMKQRVLDVLAEHIVGSKATIMYLTLCFKITSSLMEEDLSPLQRIYRLWYATFFLRAWRKWLNHLGYKLNDCFITRNAYTCVEINAANLIKLTRKFREQKCETLYVPAMFNSQPNEETFRVLRSMGTMKFTKTNFTLLEVFHLVGRVELQNDIVYIKLANQNVAFPRNKINKAQLNQYKLPSDVEIANVIDEAKKDAIADALKFSIHVELNDVESCELNTSLNEPEENSASDDESVEITTVEPINTEINSLIDITLDNGTKKTIRKSTLLWTLTDPKQHSSNDRLKRVQEANKSKHAINKKTSKPRRLVFRKDVSSTPILTLCKNEELQIGDWAIFQTDINGKNIFIVGNILSFRYKNKKSAKDRKYTWDFAPIVAPEGVEARGIEVMSSWFEIGSTTSHSPVGTSNSFFIDIEKYVITLNCGNIKLDNLGCLTFISQESVLQLIQNKLLELSNHT